MTTNMDIRLATRPDIPAIMGLEARNYLGNLDESERAGGFISTLHPVQGFIVITTPPNPPEVDPSPIIRAMLELANTLQYNGRPIAQQRFAFRGPVLVDRSARGHGLYSAFNAVTREAYRERFDVGVLFVAADNPRSLHTTTTKLGAQPLTLFEADGRQYHFLAFTF